RCRRAGGRAAGRGARPPVARRRVQRARDERACARSGDRGERARPGCGRRLDGGVDGQWRGCRGCWGGRGRGRTGPPPPPARPAGRAPLALRRAGAGRRRGSGALRAVQVRVAGTAEPPDIGRWSESLHVPVALAGKWLPEEIDARGIEFPDLLPDAGSGSWHDDEWVRRLKPAAIFAAAILLVHGALTIGDWARLAYEARSLRANMETAFRGAFPEAKVVVDPALQMRRNVADLRRAAGEPDAADMIPLLARIAPALAAAGARPQSLRYENGELQLELAVASGETRERLASRLQVPGVRVRVERVTAGGGEPGARVRVGWE